MNFTQPADSPLVICSTARLAQGLRDAHGRAQLAQAQQQWQPLQALTMQQWLDDWTGQGLLTGEILLDGAPRLVLSAMQERLLWEQCITAALKNLDSEPLFDKAGLASAAQEANRLVIEWNLSLTTEEMTEETRQFLLWRQRFQTQCKQAACLEPVRYLGWQIECIESGAGVLPKTIQLTGFDRISPQLKRLFAVLATRGVALENYATGYPESQPASYVRLDDQDAECRAAVAWVSAQYAQNPQARLAIIVPELGALRAKFAALLDEAFTPALATPAFAEAPRDYDFSLGTPLSSQPVINAALALLRVGMQRDSLLQADISMLLHNPYWSASIAEADARARLDARLREWLPLSVTPGRLQRFISNAATGEHALPLAQLNADMQILFNQCQRQPNRQLASAWANVFPVILKASYWPGERTSSSHEHQAMQSFEKVLQAYAQLDAVLGMISAQEALKRLVQLCKEQIFQAEAQAQRQRPQLQIMGMLEAAAEPLDAMWVMGMNDHLWPPAPRPNALLPAALQRMAGTPNADSATQTAFALAIHQRLLCSAKQIIFSSAMRDGERQLRISPLLKDIAESAETVNMQATLAEKLAASAPQNLLLQDDHLAPPIGAGVHVSGGTGLLKAQAICPAWAFYQYRLQARALKEPVNGLDVMERGTLVHSVLEVFWKGRGSGDIQAMSADALQAAIVVAADLALQEFNAKQDQPFPPAFLSLERARLVKLVLAWITEVEMLRPQAFTVTACEQEQNLQIQGVAIRLVVDRIDTLEDGRLVVMDYKTGRQNDYKNWAEDRIREPQLPIYAAFVLSASDVAAVCFAQVRMDKSGFAGVAAAPDLMQGTSLLDDKRARKVFSEQDFPDWPSLLRHWKNSIEHIARELKAGEAAVRFTDEKRLAYCEVLPLLRLPERQLQFERLQAESNA